MDAFLRKIKEKNKKCRKYKMNESARPLIEHNNNEARGVHGYANPLAHSDFDSAEVQRLVTLLLSRNIHQDSHDRWKSCQLLLKHIEQDFPKAPADLEQNLQQHLSTLKDTVSTNLKTLGPFLSEKAMADLMDQYHSLIFAHLHTLLQSVSSTKNYFVLMHWVSNTYLSQEMLPHPNHLLLDPWEEKATDKVLQSVQKDVRELLPKILQTERTQTHQSEETYVALYVDVIQYIDLNNKEAQKISLLLHDRVQQICFQELLTFVSGYTKEQTVALKKKTQTCLEKMDKLETIDFLKTLRICEEIRKYVQTGGNRINDPILKETEAALENMESLTLELLMKIVAHMAESYLKHYFRSRSKQLSLFDDLKTHFPKLPYALDEQKRVMDEAYKLIAHIYLKRLIQNSQSRLRSWKSDIGQTIFLDAKLLHKIISDLAPGVQPWNRLLLKIPEVLECQCIDALKIVMANIQMECAEHSDDLNLLPALLQWKGLSKQEVREVLDALPISERIVFSGSCCSCFTCF